MGNKTQVKKEGGTGNGWIQTRYCYVNYHTTNKPSFKRNIAKLKDAVFTQGHPSNATKYKDSIETLINYIQ